MSADRVRAQSSWLRATLVVIALYWVADLALLRSGAPDLLDDAWEYGVAAKTLLAGHGLRTLVIHPPLWTLRDAANTVPLLIHGPLLPALLAPALALLGDRALESIAWLDATFAVLAAAALYRLAAPRFGRDAGAGAALLFTLAPLTLQAVHHDPSVLLGGWLLTLALGFVADVPRRAGLAGLALGLAALARPEMPLALPVVMALAGRDALRTLGAFAACLLPWWIHHLLACGMPWFNLSSYLLIGYWGAHPGLSVLRDFALPPARWPGTLAAALPSVADKARAFLPHALKRALLAPTGATGWLAVVGLAAAWRAAPRALPRPGPSTRALLLAAVALAAIPLAVMSLTVYDARYLTPFLPFACLAAALGARALAALLPEWGRRPRAWIGLLLLAALPTAAPALRDAVRESRANAATLAAGRRALAPRRGGAAPMFSDTPDFVAFTTGRPTLWLTRAEYLRLPRAGDAAAAAGDLPVRGADSLETWFQDPAPPGETPEP